MLTFMANLAGVATLLAISSSSDCPSAEAVQAHLAQRFPGPAANDSVQIEQSPDGPVVVMRSALHRMVFRRQLPRSHSCEEDAALAATVIAAWQFEESQSLAEPPPVVERVKELPPPARPAPHRALRYELGGALLGAVASETFAPGGLLDLLLLPDGRQVGVRLGVFGHAPRSLALGSGQSRWLRAGLRLSGGYRFVPFADQRWSIDWFADAALAVVAAWGVGFDENHTLAGTDLGLGSSLRLGRQLGPVRLFVEVAISGWLLPQRVTAQEVALVSAALPQVEGLFSLGLCRQTVGREKRGPEAKSTF